MSARMAKRAAQSWNKQSFVQHLDLYSRNAWAPQEEDEEDKKSRTYFCKCASSSPSRYE